MKREAGAAMGMNIAILLLFISGGLEEARGLCRKCIDNLGRFLL